MKLASWVITVGGVLGVIAVIVVAFVVVKSNLAKTTAELWKGEAEAYKARFETIEEMEAVCRERVTKLETDVKVLKDLVTGEANAEAMKDYFDVFHKESREFYKEMMRALGNLGESLVALGEKLD